MSFLQTNGLSVLWLTSLTTVYERNQQNTSDREREKWLTNKYASNIKKKKKKFNLKNLQQTD